MRNTSSGADFETATDIQSALVSEGFLPKGDTSYNGTHSLQFMSKYGFVRWVKAKFNASWRTAGVIWNLLPDEAIYCHQTNTVTIVEKKFQRTQGSVDEKILTGPVKAHAYTQLFKGTGIKVRYVFLLSDWFKDEKYTFFIEHNRTLGVDTFFNSIPANVFIR